MEETDLEPIAFTSHPPETRGLLMPVYGVLAWAGEPGRRGPASAWVTARRIGLLLHPMPPADVRHPVRRPWRRAPACWRLVAPVRRLLSDEDPVSKFRAPPRPALPAAVAKTTNQTSDQRHALRTRRASAPPRGASGSSPGLWDRQARRRPSRPRRALRPARAEAEGQAKGRRGRAGFRVDRPPSRRDEEEEGHDEPVCSLARALMALERDESLSSSSLGRALALGGAAAKLPRQGAA